MTALKIAGKPQETLSGLLPPPSTSTLLLFLGVLNTGEGNGHWLGMM